MAAVPRLLILVNAFEDDAPTRLMLEIAVGHAIRGGEVLVCALTRGGMLESTQEFAVVQKQVLGSRGVAAALLSLSRIIQSFKPGIAHFSLTKPTLLGAPIALRNRVPVILATHHGSHEWEERGWLMNQFVRRAYPRLAKKLDAMVCVSLAAQTQLVQAGVPQERTQVIYNGVNTDHFVARSADERTQLRRTLFPDMDESHLLVGAAGNLRAIKGHRSLVDAAVIVGRERPRTRFVVWGEGPERHSLQTRIDRLGLSERFILAGKSPDIALSISACDIFTQPSLEEAFGMSVAEAMSCSVATVVTDAGGLPEVVASGETGLICPRGNTRSLASALLKLLQNDQRRSDMARRGRTRALEQFEIGRMVHRYLACYSRLLAAKGYSWRP